MLMESKWPFSMAHGQEDTQKNLQMEGFSIFGTGWQLEVAEKNIKELIQSVLEREKKKRL